MPEMPDGPGGTLPAVFFGMPGRVIRFFSLFSFGKSSLSGCGFLL
jgi:hypothetical protein